MYSPADKKLRLFRAWTAANPVWCTWQATYRCNFRCRFCSYWRDPMGEADEPTLAQYESAAAKLARFGTLMVSLGGGEPTLRKDLPDIVRAVGRYHFPFMTTNGWLMTPQRARELMRAGIWGVSVSVDYSDPKRHDAARGVEGAWQRAWRAVEHLSAARVHKFQRVNVISVLMEDNIDDLETLLAMAAERNAYFMVQPYSFRKTGSHDHEHNNGSVSPRLVELRRRWDNFLSNPRYLGRFDEFMAEGIGGCKAGKAFFNIDSVGDVAICVENRHRPVANIFRHDIRTIRNRLRKAAEGNTCRDCWYNCRGEIECLYHPYGLIKSLPTLLLDRGKAPYKAAH